MKVINVAIISGVLFSNSLFSQDSADMQKEPIHVKITQDIPYIDLYHLGNKVRVQRIQDTENILTDDYVKVARECPPFCIHPMKVHPDIKTVGEVEFMKFIKEKVGTAQGVIVDARLKRWHEIETIPSAINIPYPLIERAKKSKIAKIFTLLGMSIDKNSKWNFENAKELTIFCNGVWCDQSRRLIYGLLKNGYPANKISYYRDGFQGWKILGLTTVVQKEINK